MPVLFTPKAASVLEKLNGKYRCPSRPILRLIRDRRFYNLESIRQRVTHQGMVTREDHADG